LFRKTADIDCHNTRYGTNQNYFIPQPQVSTNVGKETISHRGATLWENVEQHFKDKSHTVFCKQRGTLLLLQSKK